MLSNAQGTMDAIKLKEIVSLAETKSIFNREKYIKFEFYYNKNLSVLKDYIKNVKRQITKCEKIFTNCTPDNKFVSRIHNKPLHLSNKKKTEPRTTTRH